MTLSPAKNRIAYLDAFRGLAILLVVGYHAFSRWPELVPYGRQYANVPLFKFGWLGVPLFFLISGFVILMTLEACHGVRDFLYRRWLRLFPAMLLCSALIFATAGYFVERPAGSPTWVGLWPGLLFVEPGWLEKLLGVPVVPLEGVFWSLYVEFKFYVIGAFLYFWVSKARFVHVLALLYLVYMAARVLARFTPGQLGEWPYIVCHALSLDYFGWFGAGAAYYLFTKQRDFRYVGVAIALSLFSAVTTVSMVALTMPGILAAVFVAGLFALAIVSQRFQRLLDSRVLVFFGAISYPLYLLHENMIIAMIIKLGRVWPDAPGPLLVALALAAISCLAYVIAKYAERPLKQTIDGVLRPV